MPIYEYQCSSCGKKFEKIEKFSDEPLKTHDGCGGAVARLISAPVLQFKGTGWYVTDYGHSNGSSSPRNGSESKRESKSESKSESSGSSSKSSDSGSSTSTSSSSSSSTSSKK